MFMRILMTFLVVFAVLWTIETVAAFTGFHMVDALVPRFRRSGAGPNGMTAQPSNNPGQV